MTRFEIAAPVIREGLATPYVYGSSDCFTLGCRVADVLGGHGMEATYKGAYRTLIGAHRALVKRGFKTLADLLGAHLEPCAAAQARFGDLAVVNLEDGDHVAVCLGEMFVTKTPRGPSHHSFADVTAAFRT